MQSPYEIEVNEEYVILDLIGVVGSIGGTLGLCIGFSFRDLFRDVGTFLLQSVAGTMWRKEEKETQIQREGQFQKTRDDLVAPIIQSF